MRLFNWHGIACRLPPFSPSRTQISITLAFAEPLPPGGGPR
jgi:hypothetical protein